MSKRETLSRYSLIINRLRRKPTSFEEIADYLELQSDIQGYDFTISKRTFHRDKNDIRSLYNIDIEYDSIKRAYYIEEEDSDMNDRMLEAFDVFNALNISSRVSKYISFENRKPKGTEHLSPILSAIENKQVIHFDYQKFWDEEASKREVNPLALKEFKNRWYLVAQDHKDDAIKTFALDRITDLDATRTKFSYPKDFHLGRLFEHSFGIITGEGKEPERIVLSVDSFQAKYIKSLPLHSSQRVLEDGENEVKIELTMHCTYDFIMEILSYGEHIKILEPTILVERFKNIFEQASQRYS